MDMNFPLKDCLESKNTLLTKTDSTGSAGRMFTPM